MSYLEKNLSHRIIPFIFFKKISKIFNVNHLIWILFAVIIGFLIPFLFGNIKSLPVDIYYLVYFSLISIFFFIYIRQTSLDLRKLLTTNLIIGIVLGLIFAIIMAKNVFSRPETSQLTGNMFAWALVWRGLLYGAVDGLFLSVFPWLVTWRAFDVSGRPLFEKIGFTLLAWVFVLILTTAYHAGFSDFRSKKIIQPNIGNSLISIPTFLSANPLASPIAHAGMHISAVIHSPDTDLYLPPHREQR